MSRIHALFSKRAAMVGLLAGTTALAAASFAMPGGLGGLGGQGNCAARQGQQAQSPEARQAFRQNLRAQRLDALKDKLRLKPEQETAWQAFVQALPGMGPMDREARRATRDELAGLDTPQRLDRMLARAEQRRVHMTQRAQAVKQLYAHLDAEQRKVFDAQALPFPRGHHGYRHQGGPRQQS